MFLRGAQGEEAVVVLSKKDGEMRIRRRVESDVVISKVTQIPSYPDLDVEAR